MKIRTYSQFSLRKSSVIENASRNEFNNNNKEVNNESNLLSIQLNSSDHMLIIINLLATNSAMNFPRIIFS